MWSIFPGDDDSFIAFIFYFFLELFCLCGFTTSIRSLEDDESAWEITERSKIWLHNKSVNFFVLNLETRDKFHTVFTLEVFPYHVTHFWSSFIHRLHGIEDVHIF